jgi:hypothetical protein
MKVIIPNKLVNKLRDQVKSLGIKEVSNLVGGLDTLLKVAFNDDLKEFYKTTGYVPYTRDDYDGGRMHIDKVLIDRLNLEDKPHWIDEQKKLGEFIFGTKNGPKYTFDAVATGKAIDSNGQVFMQVAGMCDELGLGFGYTDLKEKEKLGKRAQSQIYKQIIEKYNLDSYNGH